MPNNNVISQEQRRKCICFLVAAAQGKLEEVKKISDEEFKEFFKLLESKNENIQKEIYLQLLKTCIANYIPHEPGIQQALAALENSVREQKLYTRLKLSLLTPEIVYALA